MDKIEQLEQHITVLEKLANGINPIDDTLLPPDSLINNVKITRALFCVLEQLKANPKTNAKKKYFFIEEHKLETFEYMPDGAYLSQIVEKLNNLVDENKVKKLSRTKMVKWLIDLGILTTVQADGKRAKRHMPTEQGLNMGLEVVKLTDKYGNPFDAVKYPLSMQQFIIDNLSNFYNWRVNIKTKER